MPVRVAVIDIGSNSVLLLIGERTDSGWRVLLDTARITRLGEGFSQSQTLQPPAIERTLNALAEYRALCQAHSVERVIAVATAVVREARNREAFGEGVRQKLPAAEFLVLSESDEAHYSFLSVARDSDLFVGGDADATNALRVASASPPTSPPPVASASPPTSPPPVASVSPPTSPPPVASASPPTNNTPLLAVLDIGGASVEVALGREEVQHWFSFPVGAGRVRETHMPSDPPEPREVLNAIRMLDEAFAPLRELPQPDRVVAVGGTGVNLAMLALGRTQFDPMQAHGVWFGDETPAALLERLLRLSDAERRALPGIEPERAPLLHIGALILERALFTLRREEVQISARGLRYGILWSL